MGDWILYRDTGSLFHKKCKKFHNTRYKSHACTMYDHRVELSIMIVTTVNICRDALRANTWAGCNLPNLDIEDIMKVYAQ